MQRLLSAFLIYSASVLLLAACSDSGEPSAQGGGPGGPGGFGSGGRGTTTPAVEVIQARFGALPLEERLSGTVRAENQVEIYPEITAPIVRVAAQNGDYVNAGQPLVYLKDVQFKEQLRQAEAALQISQAEAKRAEAGLNELKARLSRTKQLAEQQFQSAQELEVLEAQVTAAEATYEQAVGRIAQSEATVEEQKEALRRTVVRAPISGYVGQREAEIGMRVNNNTRLFMMGNFDKVRVEVAVTDEMMRHIQEGQTALVSSDVLGNEVIQAEISRISPFLEEGNYSAEAEIDIPNTEGKLRPGMFVTVDVLYGESEQATLIPTSALYENLNTGRVGVFVATSLGSEIPLEEPDEYDAENPPPFVEPTPMVFTEVEVLARGRGMVGISGVQFGDWVVTLGQNMLNRPGGEVAEARARAVPWERVASLQELQDQDLLRQFMEKQQRMAKQVFNDESSMEMSEHTKPANRAVSTVSAAR